MGKTFSADTEQEPQNPVEYKLKLLIIYNENRCPHTPSANNQLRSIIFTVIAFCFLRSRSPPMSFAASQRSSKSGLQMN